MTLDENSLVDEMTNWRRDLHAHPEFGFEERRTAAFVAAKLREFGLDEAVEGVGGTGVVGTLRNGSGNRAIALRADMDALRINEEGDAQVYACKASVSYSREFVSLLNDPSLTIEAMTAAATIFPPGAVTAAEPMTASEDFARFLEHVPGCFARARGRIRRLLVRQRRPQTAAICAKPSRAG